MLWYLMIFKDSFSTDILHLLVIAFPFPEVSRVADFRNMYF